MIEQLPAKTAKKPRPIPRRITQAVDGLCTGQYKSITACAAALGYTREHLSKALRTPRIQVLVEERTRQILSASRMPAAATLLRLMEFAESERIKTDIAIHLLGISGHRVPANSAPVINIGIQPGYVVKLRHLQDSDKIESPEMINVTPPGEAA